MNQSVKYKIEHNKDYDYNYGEFVIAFLILVGFFIYGLTKKSFPLIIIIGSSLVLLFTYLFLSIYILKRKYIYINTIDDIIEYRNYFGKKKIINIQQNDLRYRVITDNSVQYIYKIFIINKKSKIIFKMYNHEMNLSLHNSKIILHMLIEKVGFVLFEKK